MRVGITVLACAFLLGTAPVAVGQNLNDGKLLAIAQSGIATLADSEWNKLPQTELDCVNQKLRERGDSVQSLAQRGIVPGDPRVVDTRSQCRPSSAAAAVDQSPAAKKFAVDGFALGGQVKSDSAAYREYKCGPSEQFDGFTWCQKIRNDKERSGPFTATYSILHAQDGSVTYVNRHQAPAFFARNGADEEIKRYSRQLGEPARITKKPHRAGLPEGMIALWGKIALEPLDQDSIKILAEGKSPKKGLLIDYFGNFARSAKEGMPIYRISGGAGFIWAASFDQAGRGTLRFAAVDASALSPPLLAQAPSFVPSPLQEENAPESIQARSDSADSAGTDSRLDKAETRRHLRVDTGDADQEIGPTKGTERVSLDPLVLAQYEAQKASLDAKSTARQFGTIGLLVLFMIAVLRWLMKSRKAAKARNQPSETAAIGVAIQANSSEKSARPLQSNDDQGKRVSATRPQLALSDLPPACSESVVPATVAPNDVERREEANPSRNFDEGEMVHQLAQTLGVQEPMGSLPSLAPAPSECGVTESADKVRGEDGVESARQTASSVGLGQEEPLAQRGTSASLPAASVALPSAEACPA
jgi:hypothetical protein